MKLYDSGVSLQEQRSLCISLSQWKPRWQWQPRCIMVAVVASPLAAALPRRARCCDGLQSSGSWAEAARGDSGWYWAKYGGTNIARRVFFFLQGVWRFPKKKLTSASMQSESGIVPDFEVGEEFQEEPKTYYELKSQPLKNRSVVRLRTVISHAAAVLVFRC